MSQRIYKIIPGFFPMTGLTLFGVIFISTYATSATINHELVHVEQQKRDGYWTFYWRYTTSKRWRMVYEAEAYATQVRSGHSIKIMAQYLSSGTYLWCCSYEVALEAIRSRV